MMNNEDKIVVNDNLVLHRVKKSNEFTGIKIVDNKINIFVPQVFRYDKKTFHKDILLFLKSISLAETVNKEFLNKGKNNIKNVWPFESYLWIIKDYIENDFYYNREKTYSNKGGKIEWKKTIKNTPIYSNGNLIYDKFVTSKMSATNDIIAQIYRLCLKQSIEKIGWLFNLNFKVDVQQLISKKEMIHKVKQAINNTYDDVKRIRYNHMLKILKETEGESILSNSYMYGIENYYYVYEKMIDMYFDGIKDNKKNYNPNGYWQLNNKKATIASSLRPDTIVKQNGITYIIDAKMYQYGVTHDIIDLPETQSIQKQISYGDYVMNVLHETDVRNAFILPFNKELVEFKNDPNIIYFNNDELGYIGYAYVDWRKESKYEYVHDKIHTFVIDFNYLLRQYKKDNKKLIGEMCDLFEKITKDEGADEREYN